MPTINYKTTLTTRRIADITQAIYENFLYIYSDTAEDILETLRYTVSPYSAEEIGSLLLKMSKRLETKEDWEMAFGTYRISMEELKEFIRLVGIKVLPSLRILMERAELLEPKASYPTYDDWERTRREEHQKISSLVFCINCEEEKRNKENSPKYSGRSSNPVPDITTLNFDLDEEVETIRRLDAVMRPNHLSKYDNRKATTVVHRIIRIVSPDYAQRAEKTAKAMGIAGTQFEVAFLIAQIWNWCPNVKCFTALFQLQDIPTDMLRKYLRTLKNSLKWENPPETPETSEGDLPF